MCSCRQMWAYQLQAISVASCYDVTLLLLQPHSDSRRSKYQSTKCVSGICMHLGAYQYNIHRVYTSLRFVSEFSITDIRFRYSMLILQRIFGMVQVANMLQYTNVSWREAVCRAKSSRLTERVIGLLDIYCLLSIKRMTLRKRPLTMNMKHGVMELLELPNLSNSLCTTVQLRMFKILFHELH